MVVSCATDSSISIRTASIYSPLHSQYVEQLSNSRHSIVSVGLHCILLIKESDDVQSYLSCTTNTSLTHPLDYYVEWYWKLGPYLLYGVESPELNIQLFHAVLMYELIIAQSPDKMKGLVLGIMIASNGISIIITNELLGQTLCSNYFFSSSVHGPFDPFKVLHST